MGLTMIDFLAFRLYAPLASWGDVAVGEYRPSLSYPGRSALLGLLGAALGVRRDQESVLAAMSKAYGVAVAVYRSGTLLRDYHTSQVPSAKDLKKRPQRTRGDELAVPKSELNTILSTRDYRQDALSVVLMWIKAEPAPHTLNGLRAALLQPRFTLYLGRKSCPPACPLQPQIVRATSLCDALAITQFAPIEHLANADHLERLAWEEGVPHGLLPGQSTIFNAPRKDDPRSRSRWQFSDRIEWVGLPQINAQSIAGEVS
jgi:CRISPR system Cascade subunit CasD